MNVYCHAKDIYDYGGKSPSLRGLPKGQIRQNLQPNSTAFNYPYITGGKLGKYHEIVLT